MEDGVAGDEHRQVIRPDPVVEIGETDRTARFTDDEAVGEQLLLRGGIEPEIGEPLVGRTRRQRRVPDRRVGIPLGIIFRRGHVE